MKLSTHIYSRVPFTIASIEKPVIAAVNGSAAGFGCNLALCCDMIYAAQDAKFIEIFINRFILLFKLFYCQSFIFKHTNPGLQTRY